MNRPEVKDELWIGDWMDGWMDGWRVERVLGLIDDGWADGCRDIYICAFAFAGMCVCVCVGIS